MAVLVFGVFVAGVLAMLLGVALLTIEIRGSRRSLQYQVRRVVQLPTEPSQVAVTNSRARETVQA